MHVLRSIYLPAYESLVRPPYTSDPFPLLISAPSYEESTSEKHGPPSTSQEALPTPFPDTLPRETCVFDLFIALKVREDVWLDDSMLSHWKKMRPGLVRIVSPQKRVHVYEYPIWTQVEDAVDQPSPFQLYGL